MSSPRRALKFLMVSSLFACQADPATPGPDPDQPPMKPASCSYQAAPEPAATAGTGEIIKPGAVAAGVGEALIDLPVGTPLSGYTGRMRLLGGDAPDDRQVPHARAFVPSAGVQSRPLARPFI